MRRTWLLGRPGGVPEGDEGIKRACRSWSKRWKGFSPVREDILVLIEMAYEENDDSMVKEIQSGDLRDLRTQFEEL